MDTDLIKNAKASKVLPIETSGLLLESIHGYRFAKASKALPIETSGMLLESIHGYRFDKEHC